MTRTDGIRLPAKVVQPTMPLLDEPLGRYRE
jgi:hypothetical protein